MTPRRPSRPSLGALVIASLAFLLPLAGTAAADETAPSPETGSPETGSPETGEPSEIDPAETGIATPPPDAAASAAVAETGDVQAGDAQTGDTDAAGDASVSAAASGYHFGTKALAEVMSAARSRAGTRCPISAEGLAALMLAPTYPETGAGTAGSPSPMTLSRWDTDRGLHSLSDPNRYPRAFWHPGIGVWQFDSAGGWGLTAAERMDMRVISDVAADTMLRRYCAAGGAGGGESARASAWRPWYACRSGRCESIFWSIYAGSGKPLDVDTESGIGVLGGVTTRTCTPPGQGAQTCRHVDPAAARGYTGWRGTPDGSTSVAPLSLPFDVAEVGGYEWRMWRAADTGYGVDIAARKPLVANPRAKPNPARPCEKVSPVVWYVNGSVVDSVDRTACEGAFPPPGLTQRETRVSGTYRPIVGDYDADGLDDIVWYAPGSAADWLWSSPVATPTNMSLTVNGTYQPLVGDFDGDRADDVFWYGPGATAESLWRGRPERVGFGKAGGAGFAVNGSYRPEVGDFDGDGRDDILWFSETSKTNYLWYGTDSGFRSVTMPLRLDIIDAVGDFDADGRTDLLGHRAGPAPDSFYYGTSSGFVRRDAAVSGSYRLVVGDFDDSGTDDLYWYATGSGADYVWFMPARRISAASQPSGAPAAMPAGQRAVPIDGRSGTDVVWLASGSTSDQLWTFAGTSLSRTSGRYADDAYVPISGRWTSTGEGVLLYRPGPGADFFWLR